MILEICLFAEAWAIADTCCRLFCAVEDPPNCMPSDMLYQFMHEDWQLMLSFKKSTKEEYHPFAPYNTSKKSSIPTDLKKSCNRCKGHPTSSRSSGLPKEEAAREWLPIQTPGKSASGVAQLRKHSSIVSCCSDLNNLQCMEIQCSE